MRTGAPTGARPFASKTRQIRAQAGQTSLVSVVRGQVERKGRDLAMPGDHPTLQVRTTAELREKAGEGVPGWVVRWSLPRGMTKEIE